MPAASDVPAPAAAGGGAPARAPSRRRWVAPAVIFGIFTLLWAASLWAQWLTAGAEARLSRDLARVAGDARTVVAELHSTAAAPETVGRVFLDLEARRAYLVAKGLRPAGDGRTFVAWVLRADGTAHNAGAFALAGDSLPDAVLVGVPPLADLAGIEVSAETDPRAAAPAEAEVRAQARWR